MHTFARKVESDYIVLKLLKFYNYWLRTNLENSWFNLRFCLIAPWIYRLPLKLCKGLPHWDLLELFDWHNYKAIPAQWINWTFPPLLLYQVVTRSAAVWIDFIWDSLKPDCNGIRIVWLESKINTLNVSQNKPKKQLSLIKSGIVSWIGSNTLIQIKSQKVS